MNRRVKLQEEQENIPVTREIGCRHYWEIEIANGPTSKGVCKYCGEKRSFFNVMPEYNPIRKQFNPLALPKMPGLDVEGTES
jgi:hypothetical protein